MRRSSCSSRAATSSGISARIAHQHVIGWRCLAAVQNRTWFQHRTGAQGWPTGGRDRRIEGDGIEKWLQATEFDRPLPDDRAAILAARAKSAVMFTVTADEAAWRTGHKTESIYRRYAITSEADLRERVERLDNTTEPRNEG